MPTRENTNRRTGGSRIDKRREAPQQNNGEGKYADLVDISFLPRELVERIDDIFDSYFKLGMRRNPSSLEEAPEFPDQVSSLTSPELGDVLGEYTAWFSFASDKNKYVGVAASFLESEMSRIMDEQLGEMVEDRGNIDAKKAKARSSDEYKSYLVYAQKLRGLKYMLESEVSRYDKCISSLSREVSRREHNAGF
tara:strand:+ start:69542 stop:70123 length:582 start_codon:yes stop_codon:yes gene_type:complete